MDAYVCTTGELGTVTSVAIPQIAFILLTMSYKCMFPLSSIICFILLFIQGYVPCMCTSLGKVPVHVKAMFENKFDFFFPSENKCLHYLDVQTAL